MRVYNTKNYNLFKTVEGNRDVNIEHVKNLTKSVSDKNLLEYLPIIVNEDMEIIDGQHRFMVAQESGLPVYYVIVHGADLKDVQRLNTATRRWSTLDYLESYIKRGYKDYLILKDFMTKYRFSPSISMLLLTTTGDLNRIRRGYMNDFKKGKFKVAHLSKAMILAEFLLSIKNYTESGVVKDREFIHAIRKVLEVYPSKKLYQRLSKYSQKVQRRTNSKEYLRQLEDICNYRARSEIRFF